MQDLTPISQSSIFTLKTPVAKVTMLIVLVLGIATINIIGFPFATWWLNIIGTLGFAVILLMCGQGAYVCLALASTLIDLTERSPSVPFLLHPHIVVVHLSRFYLGISSAVALGYILVLLAVLDSPYGFVPLLAAWLTILAFFPISLFSLWFLRMRRLNERIKFSFIQIINNRIQVVLKTVEQSSSKSNIEVLEKLIGIQMTIAKYKIRPMDLQSLLTLAVALLTAVSQIMLVIFKS